MFTLVETVFTNTKHVNVCFDEFTSVDEAIAMCLHSWHDDNSDPRMFYVISESNVVQAVLVGRKDSDNVHVMTIGQSTLSGIWRVENGRVHRVSNLNY